jgi:deoxyribodipyrimidine photolyase-related protein
MKRILYIPFDHLHRGYGVMKDADSSNDVIVLIESARMTTGDGWHKERLFFMISAARHFAEELRVSGFTVEYVKAATTVDGLKVVRAKHGELPIVCAEPSSFRQYVDLKKFGVEYVENDFFLTSRTLFMDWAKAQKSFLMENFYRKQRVRLGILMEGSDSGGWIVELR